MKKLLSLLLLLISFTAALRAESFTFNWAQPSSLTPAFPAPDANNRYGEYISKVTFTAGCVSLYIDDSTVKEQSQRARFLYGYLTETVEMRAYATSILKFEVPENYYIKSITFAGAKVTDEYIEYEGSYGKYEGSVWTAAEGAEVHAIDLGILATINCTSTVVEVGECAGVNTITSDPDATDAQWFTMTGIKLDKAPTAPGLYLRKTGPRTEKFLLHY